MKTIACNCEKQTWHVIKKVLCSKHKKISAVSATDMTLIRPLNEGQGHLFWYQSISHILLPIGSQ